MQLDEMRNFSTECTEVRRKMRAKIAAIGDAELQHLYYRAIVLSEHEAARRILEGMRQPTRPEYNGGDVPPI